MRVEKPTVQDMSDMVLTMSNMQESLGVLAHLLKVEDINISVPSARDSTNLPHWIHISQLLHPSGAQRRWPLAHQCQKKNKIKLSDRFCSRDLRKFFVDTGVVIRENDENLVLRPLSSQLTKQKSQYLEEFIF